MDLRFSIAKLAAFFLKFFLRLLGSGGTAAPGLLALRLDPKALEKLNSYISDTILITGTNGKTTTSRIIGVALEKTKIPYVHNREGSNLLRGLVGSLLNGTTIFPKTKKPLALLEVDELTLPSVISQTSPKIITINNLFRDQLDRYGEVDSVRRIWEKTLKNLDASTTLILNSDDPSIAHLGSKTSAKKIFFGIEDKKLSLSGLPHASDFTSCIVCGTELKYDVVYMSHLGNFRCPNCREKRPSPDVYAKEISLDDESGFKANVVTPKGSFTIKTSLPGLYNVYNSLSAIATLIELNIPIQNIIKSLRDFEAVFGRNEIIHVGGKKLFVSLVKNPTGFNEVLRTIFNKKKKRYSFIAINDLIADGRDVSWLWDVDFELMKGKTAKTYVSGIRASDIRLRLKYDEIDTKYLDLSIGESLDYAYNNLPDGETLFIFPTYTAMLEIKRFLAKKGYGKKFWES